MVPGPSFLLMCSSLIRNFKFPEVHVEGPRRIARIAALSGVSRLVHVSHLNADHASPSKVLRQKAVGEEMVRDAFDGATIVRPGWMYGHEDRLLNTMSVYPSVFRINHGDTKIKPVHVSYSRFGPYQAMLMSPSLGPRCRRSDAHHDGC